MPITNKGRVALLLALGGTITAYFIYHSRQVSVAQPMKLVLASDAQANPAVIPQVPQVELSAVLQKNVEKLGGDASLEKPLIAAVVTALDVYSDPTPDKFIIWMKKQGLVLPNDLSNPATSSERWTDLTRGLAGAELDLKHCTFEYRVQNGNEILPKNSLPGTMRMEMARPNRGTNDVNPVASKSNSIEVLIPAHLPVLNSPERYVGAVSLTFSRRPADGQWIITKTAFVDAPIGKQLPGPPPL